MVKQVVTFLVLLMTAVGVLLADGTTWVIKVNGPYGIINKGRNQGIREGQILYIRRDAANSRKDVGQVRVIRTTANRAAVEQASRQEGMSLRKGDKLFTQQELAAVEKNRGVATMDVQVAPKPRARRNDRIEPITEPALNPTTVDDPSAYTANTKRYQTADRLRKPWVSFNIGAMVPNGDLAVGYDSSVQLAGSYMVATGKDFNVGLEISKSFVGGSALSSTSFTNESSSLSSALVIFQKFFGDYMFLEGGGGIFRPKVTVESIDQVKTSYSSTHFGLAAGAGFFIPTSPYAGFTMKGRLNNYFDDSNKHYFGISGGFRFKIR